MTNRIKEKFGYRLNYNIRLNQGKIFKANTELRSLLTKKEIAESTTYEEEDEQIEILNKIDKKNLNQLAEDIYRNSEIFNIIIKIHFWHWFKSKNSNF